MSGQLPINDIKISHLPNEKWKLFNQVKKVTTLSKGCYDELFISSKLSATSFTILTTEENFLPSEFVKQPGRVVRKDSEANVAQFEYFGKSSI